MHCQLDVCHVHSRLGRVIQQVCPSFQLSKYLHEKGTTTAPLEFTHAQNITAVSVGGAVLYKSGQYQTTIETVNGLPYNLSSVHFIQNKATTIGAEYESLPYNSHIVPVLATLYASRTVSR